MRSGRAGYGWVRHAKARQRVLRARRLGYYVPPAPRRPAALDTIDYAEVAAIARRACAANRSMRAAIANRYRISLRLADSRITHARLRGHFIPAAITGRKPRRAAS